jgi:hypothetical protein
MNDTARIEALEARAHISDLVHGYAQGVRSGNFERCASMFTEDAMFEIREGMPGDAGSARTRATLSGRDAIRKYLQQTAAAGGVCPLISNLIVQVQGREATANSVMTGVMLAGGTNVLGEYHDSFRNDGEWRFSSRVYTIFRARG